MSVPLTYGYLIGDAAALFLWLGFFLARKDTRREMLTIGLLVGFLSVCSSYYWWTQDWWHPQTITGTRVGIEDFLSGFAAGGVMAVIYEVLFKKQFYRRKSTHHYPGPLTILLALTFSISWLFWGVGLTSFWASALTLTATSFLLYYYRRDLFMNSMVSGLLTAFVSLPIYYVIIFTTPGWVQATYNFAHLSGFMVTGIPIEELVFWFLTGLVFGPFYEYCQGERLRSVRTRK